MGTNLPQNRTSALSWLEGHIVDWNSNYAGIGLTSAAVIDLAQDIANSRGAFTSVEQIRAQSKSTTQDWYAQIDATTDKAGDMIATIKAFAESSADPASVYLLAGITGANPPSPALPPEQAVIDNANLSASGSVTIEFSGRGPVGTVWLISRKLDTQTGFTFLGQADGKKFVDNSLPTGVTTATYTVQGVRGSLTGSVSAPVTFFLGSAEQGQLALAA